MRKLTAGGSLDDLITMAQAWGQADRHKERTEWLQRAAKIAPPERRADILHALGMAYSARGMRDPAEHALEEAAALDPKNIALSSDLAHLYFDRRSEGGRLEKAIHLRETVLAAASDDANNWEQLGLAYSAAGQAAKAVRCLEHAIDLEPGDGPAYLELSKAYAPLGDAQSSKHLRSLYARFVAYDQNRQTLRTRAWRPGATAADVKAYADLMYKIGAFEDAAQWYEKALYLAPNNTEVRERLIAAYTRLRRVDRILELRTETKS
jgi:tetratricopeptide (TPR) repeat protein